MVVYCINMILCSALLLFLYKFLLEKEKMHDFKRAYLILSVLISLTAPLITISFTGQQQLSVIDYIPSGPGNLVAEQSAIITGKTMNNPAVLLAFIYFIGLTLGLSRFLNILLKITTRRYKAKSVAFRNTRLVLLEKNVLPHSFLNMIFLNRKAYLEGKIEKEVMEHELAHVKQHHSLDILFIQLVHCIFWFNPVYIFYRRAIQLNHEFLADEAVLHSSDNPLSYQYLLLRKISKEKSSTLASPFNYSVIKKRLVMITTTTSRNTQIFKTLVAVALFMVSIFFFATKESIAQKIESSKGQMEAPFTIQGASPEEMTEYKAIVANHRNAIEKRNIHMKASKEEREKLFVIYTKMSKEQQTMQEVGFVRKAALKTKKSPTDEQLQKWTDPKKYFVRINGRKIDNSILESETAANFIIYEYYVPNKGSTDYGKYEAQVNLLTNEAYNRYVKSWNEQDPYLLVVFNKRIKK